MSKIERRIFPAKELRLYRSRSGGMTLEGYSAVFGKPSENLGWGDFEVREYIAPGAFTEALRKSDCRAVFNHDPNLILGRESAGTLELKQDSTGLRSVIHLPDTQLGRDLAVSVERGDIREQSFCFVVGRDQWEEDQKKRIATRTILEIRDLIDISPVTYPAYPDTDIARREALRRFGGKVSGQSSQRLKHFDRHEKTLKIKGLI
ncbi:hypothetical protein LZ24_00181 [Desulfobotulus alkaliphilus]|uniref:Prohead serine protease domain-containing protein n=1 Tax=Desulfobotulus alkaliphilus TaxID=622671 RepID=A0A562S7I4_9BACT|nr:HK97 family phage prohead protease [Desulfobotulus alkaliphilus]TWI77372.1 hypothetical protein LZ24_00181 [Desulfobotulus alkaliphilus]